MPRNIVVTGLGVVSPVGVGVDAFWDSLLHRRSGVVDRPELQQGLEQFRIFAPVDKFDPKAWVRPRKALKVMCRPIQFGYAAAVMALQQAGISANVCDPDRVGTVFGSETFFADPSEVAAVFKHCMQEQNYVHDRWGEFAMRDIQPLWMLKYLPNMVASHISIAADARGPSNSICQGEVSGLLALIEGATLIERGVCDVVVVGGTGSQTSLSGMLYRGHDVFSQRFEQPERACRPFDSERDGLVSGEGAGAIILESAQHAEGRGAIPLARISGWSRLFAQYDSDHFQAALQNGLRSALDHSEFCAADLAHVNAHGSSQINADAWEATAINAICTDTPVIAPKSNFGQLGPGSPIVELVASILSLRHRILPPTLNFETPDPRCPVPVVTESIASNRDSAVKISFSPTGQIACLGIQHP